MSTPIEEKPVKKCICFDMTFEDIKATGLTRIDDIIYALGASSACGLCKPYIEALLATGETEFEIFPVTEDPT